MRTVRDISRDDRARIATCSLRTLTDSIDINITTIGAKVKQQLEGVTENQIIKRRLYKDTYLMYIVPETDFSVLFTVIWHSHIMQLSHGSHSQVCIVITLPFYPYYYTSRMQMSPHKYVIF